MMPSISKADLPVVTKELRRLKRENRGQLTPAIVVTEARKKRSPLHKFFEWDDSVAGHQFRLQQAGYLVNAVIKVIPTKDGGAITVPVYLSVPSSKGGVSYEETEIVMQDDAKYQYVLARVVSQLGAIRRKHENLIELRDVFSAIDKLQAA